MYISPNFASKAAARRAIAAGEEVRLYPYGPFDKPVENGSASVEGPWYPQPHRWWGTAMVANGLVVKIA